MKLPFNLRQRGALTFLDWMPSREGKDRARLRPTPVGGGDAEHDPAADPLLPPIPAFEFDQRLSW
jgi:hypothetical protein